MSRFTTCLALAFFGCFFVIVAHALWQNHATFKQRWAPVLTHPLQHLQKGMARDGYCFPGMCRVG